VTGGLKVDSWSPVEIGFGGTLWPVATSYAIRESRDWRDEPDRPFAPVHHIEASGPPLRRWSGIGPIADEIANLTSETAVIAWVREWGFVGLAGDVDAASETVQGVIAAATHLGRCRSLLRALHDATSPADLGVLARDVGAIWDEDVLANQAGLDVARFRRDRDPGTALAVQALDGFGRAIARPLHQLTFIDSWLIADESTFRLQPKLVARSPLGLAYLETLVDATRLRLAWERGETVVEWRQPRACVVCGRTFTPHRTTARYCSQRCKWTATKRRQRERSSEDDS
jgi:predicted nucleic acid-binding Zn ribbon protein